MAEEQNEVFSFIFDALYSYDNKGEYLIFKVSNNEIVRNHIEAIITNIYQQQLNHSFTLKLLVGLLLTELMNNPHLIETYESNNSILKYITLNYQEGSLSVLAKQIHQPDYKICKLIKEHTGSTFKQLIQEERLKAAANLLKTTSLPIVEIMQEVGYENITYFYKIFKEKFKITPSIYRNHNLR